MEGKIGRFDCRFALRVPMPRDLSVAISVSSPSSSSLNEMEQQRLEASGNGCFDRSGVLQWEATECLGGLI